MGHLGGWLPKNKQNIPKHSVCVTNKQPKKNPDNYTMTTLPYYLESWLSFFDASTC